MYTLITIIKNIKYWFRKVPFWKIFNSWTQYIVGNMTSSLERPNKPTKALAVADNTESWKWLQIKVEKMSRLSFLLPLLYPWPFSSDPLPSKSPGSISHSSFRLLRVVVTLVSSLYKEIKPNFFIFIGSIIAMEYIVFNNTILQNKPTWPMQFLTSSLGIPAWLICLICRHQTSI